MGGCDERRGRNGVRQGAGNGRGRRPRVPDDPVCGVDGGGEPVPAAGSRAAAWAGVRDCSAFTGRAPQAGLRPATRPELENFSGAADRSPETEDCLTVNVWTPACDAAKRPVMVWFHGGAFAYGNANSPRTRGSRLAARNDVVVVTVNQRLNIFGHLDLSAVGGEAFRLSGNAGTLDMVAALEWVRDNIAGVWRRSGQCHGVWRVGRRGEGRARCCRCRARGVCFIGRSFRVARRCGCARRNGRWR